jgi:NOL1/NOP2/fmu family ribosome biogenesis protein
LAEADERRRILAYMEERFGIPPSAFDDYLLFRRKNTWRILRRSPHLETAFRLRVGSVGVQAFHRIRAFIKPTTRLIQAFGRHATRSRVALDRDALAALARGEEVPLKGDLANGYVILDLNGEPLGVGLLIDGRLRSQIPKSELRFFSKDLLQGMTR